MHEVQTLDVKVLSSMEPVALSAHLEEKPTM